MWSLESKTSSTSATFHLLGGLMGAGKRKDFIRSVGDAYTRPVLAEQQREHLANAGKASYPDLWNGHLLDGRGARRVSSALDSHLRDSVLNSFKYSSAARGAVGDLTVAELCDLAIYYWAAEHYRAKAVAAGNRCMSKPQDAYASNAVLWFASGRASREAWLAMVEFYILKIDGGTAYTDSELGNEDQHDRGEGGNQPTRASTGGTKVDPRLDTEGGGAAPGGGVTSWRYTRLKNGPLNYATKANGVVDLSRLAAELQDALRERITPDLSGDTMRRAGDVAGWAAGVESTPFGEPEAALSSPVELIVLVDASSSTRDNGAHHAQALVAGELVRACRAVGHSVAVAPWGNCTDRFAMRDSLAWAEPLPDAGLAWMPNCGTDSLDIVKAVHQVRATSPSSGRARSLVLVLSDGEMDTVPPIPGCTLAFWGLGQHAKIPAGWTGPAMMSSDLDKVGSDLAGSDLMRFLCGLGG